MRIKQIALLSLGIILFECHLNAQQKDGKCNSELQEGALKTFVQEFYNWYAIKANSSSDTPSDIIAIKLRKSDFDPSLENALVLDWEAQRRTPGEIVGIDFDPFLNTHDPARHYEIGNAVRKGEVYMVDIHAATSGEKSTNPDVVAEVRKSVDRWHFVNFHYPNIGVDLITILKQLAADREKIKKQNQ